MIVRNFEYLLALHREEHFGRAAKACNVSQPTLSAGIKQLEEDTGVQIVRHGRRYDGLTREGERVLVWAQQMYDDCKGLERDLSALRRGLEGQFRLGVQPGVSAIMPTISVALSEKIPFLEQSIQTRDLASLLTAVRRHELDIALVYTENLDGEEFDTHLLYRERLLLFLVGDDTKLRNVNWEEMKTIPLCLMNASLPELALAQLSQRDAQTIYTDSMEVLVKHLAAGRYFSVLPQSLAGRLMEVPRLRALTITGPGTQANVGFVASKNGLENATSRALLEMIHMPELIVRIKAILSTHRRLRPKIGRPITRKSQD
ncbi:hypothetical protein N182_36405 [Sinorhizobium sp. GL2]|nr:hypothetical protein N182_36405 [Sinorhizobium sp. GL2]